MEWVASTLTPPPNVVYPALLKLMRTTRLPAIDWTDAFHRFKWTRPFRGKTKSGFCACAIKFRTSYTNVHLQCAKSRHMTVCAPGLGGFSYYAVCIQHGSCPSRAYTTDGSTDVSMIGRPSRCPWWLSHCKYRHRGKGGNKALDPWRRVKRSQKVANLVQSCIRCH